jgi:imidazolonepropionase-like amidohydrolase
MINTPLQSNYNNAVKYLSIVLLFLSFSCNQIETTKTSKKAQFITALNSQEIPTGDKTYAIVGVSLIDGISDTPFRNASVIVHNGIISEVETKDSFQIPEGAQIIDGEGLTLLPGLIDAHYHNSKGYPAIYLKKGITSLRDPGIWIEDYDLERQSGKPLPRLFLTGPHLDMPPPTYPNDAYVVRDKTEVQKAMEFLINEGGTAIKVYFRLSLGLIKEACDIAHAHGLPVTGHLEITDARQAIEAGLDGIEHVTSFGTTLTPQKKAEVYRQKVLGDSNERKQGRYEMWKDIDVNSEAADSLLNFLVEHQTFVTPTLGAFEYRLSDIEKDTIKFLGFQNMMNFIGRCQESEVRLVVGSHGPYNKYIEMGWAYQHELELFSKTGMSNMKIIKAATIENARFFKIDERLGSIEKGKQADLLLIEGDPLADIKALYNIEKVMLNGKWVD